MLDRFFISGQPPYPLLWPGHDPWLVVLSILVDIGASIVALHMAALARQARNRQQKQIALVSGTLALGAGIWAMHFVGMLAFDLCAQGRFNLGLTFVSILPSLAASWFALGILARERITQWPLIRSGIWVASGIGTMHYIGMEAASIAPILRYDPWMFVLSIVVAIFLAILALWIRFGLKHWRWRNTLMPILLAGTVMGLSITAMHYIGMAAIRFTHAPMPPLMPPLSLLSDPAMTLTALDPSQRILPLAIVAVTTALGLMAIAINISLRYREMLAQTLRSELLQRAVLETAVDGVIMINAKGLIQSFNPAAERIFGWQAHEVIGKNVNVLMPEPHHSAHDSYLHRHLETGHTAVIGQGREVEGLHKQGHRIPLRLAVGRVEQPDAPLFVGFLVDLTHYKQLEQERQRGEAQLRSLVSNLPGVAFRCLQSPGWPMIFISEPISALTGWHADDFLQGRIQISQIIHPHDIERITAEVDRALQEARPYRVEYRIRTPEGQTRWLVEFGRGMREGDTDMIDGVMLDITESKMRTAEFEGTVEALDRSEAIAEFNLRGRVIRVNENFVHLMGYSEKEAIGLSHKTFCPPAITENADYETFWNELRAGRFQSGEFQQVGKDGREVWIYATYNPILDADGQVFKIIELASDLSERRAMEQDLRIAKERAEQAAAARSSFLANMSHEIRTPMNAIIGFSEILLESPLNTEQRHHLNTVHQSARSLLRLINDILDTAKLEKGAVTLELAPFSLRESAAQLLDILKANADKKGLQLALHYSAETPEFWLGDAFRLQQILLNLMGNAIKFTETGQVTLRITGQGGALTLSVEDTGIGMDESALERIFSPFAQADASTTRRYGGTGLGTSIALQLARLMGGDIRVQSRVNQGSTFTVHLPLQLAPTENSCNSRVAANLAEASQLTPSLPSIPQKLPPLHILAVDDVATNLELLKLVLEREGHSLVCVESGEEALDAISGTAFDMILMDIQMPGMDGLETTRRIRAIEQAQQKAPVPIIALSANVMAQDKNDAQTAGMDGFANKPLEPERLMAEMARTLKWMPSSKVIEENHTRKTSAENPPETDTVIDWTRGLRLWPKQAILQDAIIHFVQETRATLFALDPTRSGETVSELHAMAHRLKGAAGNLALPQLEKYAEELERKSQNANQTEATQLTRAAQYSVLIDKLKGALSQIEAHLSKHPPEKAASTAIANHQPLDCGLACDLMQQMERLLKAGAYPQTELEELEKLLPSNELTTLKSSLDRFDFDAAQKALQHLRSALENRRNAS